MDPRNRPQAAQKHSEEVAAAERFARSILEQATDFVLVCDRAGRLTKASWSAERLLNCPLVGQPVLDIVPLDIADTDQLASPGSGASAEAFLGAVLAGKSFHGIEARIRSDQLAGRHFLLSAGPLYDNDAQGIGCILTLTDITDRKRAEEHQTTLVAEFNHRVKNILAVVQSVAWQTLSNSPSLAAFKDAFDGRLKAISVAHDVLTHIRWGNVELERLVAQSLAPYSDPQRKAKVVWSGPPLLLPAKAVVPLAMVLHELSTNAAKYGAFCSKTGVLELKWQLLDNDSNVELTWAERGGPRLTGDQHAGFGTKLISRVIAYDLHGNADLAFEPEGFRCTLSFPMPVERGQGLGPALARIHR